MNKRIRPIESGRSACPVANSLDIFGDKWTFLIIRDILFRNRSEYGEFLAAEEKISTNVLADRLKRLEESGIVVKTAHPENRTKYKYRLTPKGQELLPILVEIAFWGLTHIKGAESFVPEITDAIQENKRKFLKQFARELAKRSTE